MTVCELIRLLKTYPMAQEVRLTVGPTGYPRPVLLVKERKPKNKAPLVVVVSKFK